MRTVGSFGLWSAGLLLGVLGPIAPLGADQAETSKQGADPVSGGPAAAEAGPTEAERLLRLESILELDREKLSSLEEELKQKTEAFDEIAEAIRVAETELQVRRDELEQVDRGENPERARSLENDIEALESRLITARKQSEVSFQAAKTVQTQIETLKEKIAGEERAIQDLIGEPAQTPVDSTELQESQPLPEASSPLREVAVAPGVTLPQASGPEPPEPRSSQQTAEQIEARREAERAAGEAEQAERQVRDFVDRKSALEQQIELEEQLLAAARDSRNNFSEYLSDRRQELREATAAGASRAESSRLQREIERVQEMVNESAAEVDHRQEYLSSLRERLVSLQEEQLVLIRQADERRLAAEQARRKSVWLESPLHPENLKRWALTRGPRILLVLGVTFVLLILVRMLMRRVARAVVRGGRGTGQSRTNRADTLALSFRSALTVMIVAAAFFLVLQEAGVDVRTVLGGAAILGVAFAFGAQNLMRDYFSGFTILLEDQFELGDLVTISGITGTVERVNMRTTMLRDLEGRVHFIPNGEIKAITNRTYVWGRALIEVPVGVDENVDRVMAVLLEIAQELKEDPEWSSSVTDEPVMLGVDRFTEFGVVIKFMVQTQPDRIFPTRRELLRRIKNRFDELGIAISVPYRKVLASDGDEH